MGDRIDGRFLQSLTLAVVLASFFADSGLMKAVIPTRSIRSSRQLMVHQYYAFGEKNNWLGTLFIAGGGVISFVLPHQAGDVAEEGRRV
jgi:hypothetical protein